MAKKNKKQFYTEDERIQRVWASEDIKDLMSRRAVYAMNEDRRQELDDLWVSSDFYKKSASLGRNWGYYVGMDEINNYYVVKHAEDRQKKLDAMCAAHPEITNIRDNLDYGSMTMHPMTTPLVVIAGDGKTAQGTWWSLGFECFANPDGDPLCMWYGEKYAADFVLEEDGWKIWHLFITSDFEYEAGTPLAAVDTFQNVEDIIPAVEFGEPTIKMNAHNRSYGWIDGYPALPNEHYTYSDEIGYGPEGNPRYEED